MGSKNIIGSSLNQRNNQAPEESEFKLEKRGSNRLEFLYFFEREMVDGE